MGPGVLRRDFLKGAVAAAGLLPHLRAVASPATWRLRGMRLFPAARMAARP